MTPFFLIQSFGNSMIFRSIWSFFGWGAPPSQAGAQSPAPTDLAAQATPVTVESALQISTVFAATRLIAETVASLPFDLYEKTPEGRIPSGLSLRKVLTRRPNRYQTRVEFWESIVFNLVLSGNACCVITRVGREIASLLPVSSSQVIPEVTLDGTVIYKISNATGEKIYQANEIWHIKLFGNGVVGLSPLAHAAQSVSVSQAAAGKCAEVYANGAKRAGILTSDRIMTDAQRAKARENFYDLSSGANSRLFILEADLKFQPTSMSPEELELLDALRYQVEDIGRFFGVPSILLNQTVGQSSLGSNVNEILAAFYKLNLRPYLEKIEESILRWLVPDDGKEYEAEFDFDALLRADTATRLEAWGRAIQTGQLTPNEARMLEGHAPLEGGDLLMIQSGTVPITSIGAQK